jgi:DNA helicase-2/ATP-dependent DNA helicase PcrA
LIAPVKYYVTQQSRMGDRHVYGAKSRFLNRAVMACLEQVTWPETAEGMAQDSAVEAPRVDVAARLRGMWS